MPLAAEAEQPLRASTGGATLAPGRPTRADGSEDIRMFTLHIEHTVTGYDAWKRMFDADPVDRKGSGVTAYRVRRPVGDTGTVMVELDFDSREAGERMGAALDELWKGPAAAITINPHSRLTETVETATL
ncbi:hypothetical protein SAMN05216282_13210 [Cryobacterium psychrotolerans]|uniref:Cyclase n=1 Tax=Cryobacterium psychrotolerans TaxID=386301 RepID=A0A1G9HJL4_9MICO|nr:hypothetical protein [Cryobacterium psychrotolerans]TFD91537.1 hypothetical protein E3T56_00030 [Cryobacterium psychrotolerans]SDL12956.1 hypothetical protein SAMN05216282_13210 [Cryobacterium psychrotolerans]